jgi:hypothetical protein
MTPNVGTESKKPVPRDNVANGFGALESNSQGSDNTADGNYALLANVIGGENTAIGSIALYFNTGNGNTGVGFNSGHP